MQVLKVRALADLVQRRDLAGLGPFDRMIERILDEDAGRGLFTLVDARFVHRDRELVRAGPDEELRADLRRWRAHALEVHGVAGDIRRLPDAIPDHGRLARLQGVEVGVDRQLGLRILGLSVLHPGQRLHARVAVPGRLRALGIPGIAAELVQQHLEDLAHREAGGDREALDAVLGGGGGGLLELVLCLRRGGNARGVEQVGVVEHHHRVDVERDAVAVARHFTGVPDGRRVIARAQAYGRHQVVDRADRVAEDPGGHLVDVDNGHIRQLVRGRRRR